jgi:hypothetical protein
MKKGNPTKKKGSRHIDTTIIGRLNGTDPGIDLEEVLAVTAQSQKVL